MSRRIALTALFAVALLGSGWLMADDAKISSKGKGSLPANWGKLGLSDDQKKQIYSIIGEYRAKIDALQVQIDDMKRKEKADLTKVLTPAQKARLKEILASKAGADEKEEKPKEKIK